MSEDDGTAVAVLIGEEQARRVLADPDEKRYASGQELLDAFPDGVEIDDAIFDLIGPPPGLLYVGPCCPDEVQARGNDMAALTCHCGEPCALECGLCARCGSHQTWRPPT